MSVPLKLCVLPGDGIGPEVTEAALEVLQAVAPRAGLELLVERHLIGAEALRRAGVALPNTTAAAALGAHAVLLGAVGDPAFDDAPLDQRPEAGLLALRQALGVYANLRPATFSPAVAAASPLKRECAEGADLVVVRELLGGLYFGRPRGRTALGSGGHEAFDTMRYTTFEIERVARRAFALARTRRRHVTSVDKANVLASSQLWREVVSAIAHDFPDVRLEHVLVDACAMRLVTAPASFDVILTENLFGDILSDEAAVLFGTLGMLPSASLGDGPGLFEPVHGSAPDLAGRDVANPTAAMLSAMLLLQHTRVGDAQRRAEAAAEIVEAIASTHASGCVTRDLVPAGAPDRSVSCSAFTARVVAAIQRTEAPFVALPCWGRA